MVQLRLQCCLFALGEGLVPTDGGYMVGALSHQGASPETGNVVEELLLKSKRGYACKELLAGDSREWVANPRCGERQRRPRVAPCQAGFTHLASMLAVFSMPEASAVLGFVVLDSIVNCGGVAEVVKCVDQTAPEGRESV